MARDIDISTIIPTYNRRELLVRAIESVMAQTRVVDEIIVIDDGSSDGTEAELASRYGERIQYVRQDNAGVSAARNRGLALARGRYLALLDSDDVWHPDKIRQQFEWLEARPDYGMVLCDVEMIDDVHGTSRILHRRNAIPEDGRVAAMVASDPSLVPSSIMFRREVYSDIGGFDENLPTAEDIDFHLRVALRWPIGVVEQSLVSIVHGHSGLSALPRTYDDYVHVMERALGASGDQLTEHEKRTALAATYLRNARGMLICSRWRSAMRLAVKAWRTHPNHTTRRAVLRLVPFAGRRFVRKLLPRRAP